VQANSSALVTTINESLEGFVAIKKNLDSMKSSSELPYRVDMDGGTYLVLVIAT
jgi:hypothetical protein